MFCFVLFFFFPVVTHGCWELDCKEGGVPKNWYLRTIWCWRLLLWIPWKARRSNQSILRDINPESPLEGLMLKLKFQYSGHLTWTANSLLNSLMLRMTEDRRRREHQRMRWLDGITDAVNMNFGKLRKTVRDREAWHAAVHGVAKSRTWLGRLNNEQQY